ncbi:hypothetical protein [Puniceicoccus vermicola]
MKPSLWTSLGIYFETTKSTEIAEWESGLTVSFESCVLPVVRLFWGNDIIGEVGLLREHWVQNQALRLFRSTNWDREEFSPQIKHSKHKRPSAVASFAGSSTFDRIKPKTGNRKTENR